MNFLKLTDAETGEAIYVKASPICTVQASVLHKHSVVSGNHYYQCTCLTFEAHPEHFVKVTESIDDIMRMLSGS
jgi:hypothetical protein